MDTVEALDAIARLVLFLCVLAVCGALVVIPQHKPREYPRAYCIDPFASEDLGTTIWTPCTLVPMWSMKV